MEKIIVKSNGKKKIQTGHLWVFSNELIHNKSIEPGSLVEIYDSSNHYLGFGYYNIHSLISLRVLTTEVVNSIEALISSKIDKAIALRNHWNLDLRYCRLVYSEGDLFPGLIIDRYGDYLVLENNTAGINLLLNKIVAILTEKLSPKGIIIHSDTDETNNLVQEKLISTCFVPEEPVEIIHNDLKFLVDLKAGQKTGFFYDQRENQKILERIPLENKKVLDLFSYLGAWGIKALQENPENVTFIDSSAHACSLTEKNIQLNHPNTNYTIINEDAFKALKDLKKQGRKFDVIILDPPAFIKKKSQVKNGLKGYYHLNELGMNLLEKNGIFITCSCSYHLHEPKLKEIVKTIASKNKLKMNFLMSGNQAFDHPILITHPETEYLKCLVYQKT